MKYLIVNADDFALTRGVTKGIIEAHEFGIVRSTTMLANTEHFDYAVSLLEKYPSLGVGVHLSLTYGRPISEDVGSIVDRRGDFFKAAECRARIKTMDFSEIKREFSAQIDKLIYAGVNVTHLDTHGHIHDDPKIHEVIHSLAIEYGVGMRKTALPCCGVATTDEFTDKFRDVSATELNFKMLIKKYERLKSLEIMCHPGHFDEELMGKSRYAKGREVELSVLVKYELQAHLDKMGVELINFSDL